MVEFTTQERTSGLPNLPLEVLNDLSDSGNLKDKYRVRAYNLSVYHDLLLIRIVKTIRKRKTNYSKKQALEKAIEMLKDELGRRGLAIEKLDQEDLDVTIDRGNKISRGKQASQSPQTTPPPPPADALEDF